MKWFVKCIRDYATFKGRARRSEYWYFTLFSLIFMVITALLDYAIFDTTNVGVLRPLFALFILIPSLAVSVRRLHDTNRSGKLLLWYYLTCFVWIIAMVISGTSFFLSAMQGVASGEMPSLSFIVITLVGAVVILIWAIKLLVWVCTDGTKGDNKYGPDPKAAAEV